MDFAVVVLIVVACLPAAVAALFAYRASSRVTHLESDEALSDSRLFGELRTGMRDPGLPDASAFERAAHDLLFNADLAVVLFNFSPDAIIVADDGGKIALSNRQAELLTGYPRSALFGGSVDVLLPDSLRRRHAAHRAHFMEDPRLRPMGAHLDLRLRRKNGTEVPVDINLSPVATTRGMYVIATIRAKSTPVSLAAAVLPDPQ